MFDKRFRVLNRGEIRPIPRKNKTLLLLFSNNVYNRQERVKLIRIHIQCQLDSPHFFMGFAIFMGYLKHPIYDPLDERDQPK